MSIYLVRHGETDWSLSRRHTSVTEVPLTLNGEQEAGALAPRLQALFLTQVLVSPRLRAQQTCALAGLGTESSIEPDLAEWDYGRFEGLRSSEILQERPGWNLWRDGCPEGESPEDISRRADRLIVRLAAIPGPVGLFTHGHFGAALAARWIGLVVAAGQHFALHTASLSLLDCDPHHAGCRTIALWNEKPLPV